MSKKNIEKLFLEDILEAIAKIERYIDGVNKEEFFDDEKCIDAVIRNLEIIGEATRQLPQPFTSQHPEIEWKKIIGLRNRIVHEYFGIDLELIWQITQADLLPLKNNIQKMLKSL
jgi:uncharacterized protein with HEPN domain